MEGNNKRATICGVAIVPVSGITMSAHIGINYVNITPAVETIEFERVQSASFLERRAESGDYVDQEFECVFTDSSQTAVTQHQTLPDTDAVVLIKYSNGIVLMAGTDLSPVRCEVEESGNPKTFKVSFKRKSPEFAKFVQSLS